MSRITTNVMSMVVQRGLIAAGQAQQQSLERLSTGLRINRASDDPAGLVASQRLQSEIVALDAAVSNATRAVNIVSTADGGLAEVSSLLLDIQGLVDEAANGGGLTADELAANQLQIDEAIASIDRIVSATQFNGQALLDGTLGFDTSGVVPSELSTVLVNEAIFDGSQKAIGYNIDATTAAKAEVTMAAADIAGADGSVTIAGNTGSTQVAFTAGMNQAQVIQAVNDVTDLTGVVAVADGADIDFRSASYGDSQFVSFTRAAGATFALSGDDDYGADATVTSVDGLATGISVEGLRVAVDRADLELEFIITDNSVVQASGSFNVAAGGLQFQIAPQLGTGGQVCVGVRSVGSQYLGDAVTGYLNSLATGGVNALASGHFTAGAAVVSTAQSQVSGLRGRLGAVQQNSLETAIRSMSATRSTVSAAESAISGTDFALETANLTRAQILVQVGVSMMAMANANSRNVLTLFGAL